MEMTKIIAVRAEVVEVFNALEKIISNDLKDDRTISLKEQLKWEILGSIDAEINFKKYIGETMAGHNYDRIINYPAVS